MYQFKMESFIIWSKIRFRLKSKINFDFICFHYFKLIFIVTSSAFKIQKSPIALYNVCYTTIQTTIQTTTISMYNWHCISMIRQPAIALDNLSLHCNTTIQTTTIITLCTCHCIRQPNIALQYYHSNNYSKMVYRINKILLFLLFSVSVNIRLYSVAVPRT